MKNKFKTGDIVSICYFDIQGTIVSIESASEKIKVLMDSPDDFFLYKIEISKGVFLTTNEDSLELVLPERISDQ